MDGYFHVDRKLNIVNVMKLEITKDLQEEWGHSTKLLVLTIR